jgi:O-antigen/teichoic acid export membrane protein
MELSRRPSLRLNVVANYAGKLWSITSVYIFVPIYIRILGMEAYGLIGFNAIALGLLFIFDTGLSASFAREAAKGQRGQDLLDLLTSVERVLFGILIVIGAAFAALAPLIADYWLDGTQALEKDLVVQSLQLMPLGLVPQIAMSLYFGGLMGLERQVSANLLSITFNVIRSGCVVIPIYFLPDVRVFFAWQALASIVLMLIMRSALHRHIRCGDLKMPVLRGRFSMAALFQIRRYALGMLGMSIVAALNTQIDKLVVSKIMPLAEFAQYSIAFTLALCPYVLTLPIATALLPRFTNLLETNRSSELAYLYRTSTYYLASIGTIAGAALCLFVDDIMTLWMRGQPLDHMAKDAVRLLALGSIFLTFQLAPYQLSLAHGHTKTNLRLSVFTLLMSFPLLVYLTKNYGMVGAAVPWLIMNTVAFVYLGVVLNSRFTITTPTTYFVKDTIPAVLVGVLILGSARLVTDTFNANALTSCLCAALAAITAIVLSHILRRRFYSITHPIH